MFQQTVRDCTALLVACAVGSLQPAAAQRHPQKRLSALWIRSVKVEQPQGAAQQFSSGRGACLPASALAGPPCRFCRILAGWHCVPPSQAVFVYLGVSLEPGVGWKSRPWSFFLCGGCPGCLSVGVGICVQHCSIDRAVVWPSNDEIGFVDPAPSSAAVVNSRWARSPLLFMSCNLSSALPRQRPRK